MNEHYVTEKTMRYLREYKDIKVKLDSVKNTHFYHKKTYEAAYRIMSTFPEALEKEYLKESKTSFELKDPKWFFGYVPGKNNASDGVLMDLLTELLKPFGFKVSIAKYYNSAKIRVHENIDE